MSARRAAAAIVLALLSPGVAHAQQRDARPAVGGGSFNDAPLLAPGRYHDTLRLGEHVYYAFAVKAGQRLHVRAIVPGDGERVPGQFFAISVMSPMRNSPLGIADDLGGHGSYVFDTDQQIDFRTTPVDTLANAVSGDSGYDGPGAWFVSFSMQSIEETPNPIEVPVEFEVAVEGTLLPEPRPTATPAATATAAAPAREERGGTWAAGLLVAGLAGLLVGLALAVVARVRARPRSA